MKKLKRFLFIAILGIASNVQAGPDHSDYKTVVEAFVQSRIHTDYSIMKTILSEDAVEKLPRLNMTYETSAADLLRVMKSNNGMNHPCTSSYKVLAESNGMVMVQVDFIYAEQVISDFLTLEREHGSEWKVTRINKFFRAAPESKEIATAP